MKIKLLTDYTTTVDEVEQVMPTGSVLELEDAAAEQLIADGTAEAYTEEAEAAEAKAEALAVAAEAKALAATLVESKKLDLKTQVPEDTKMNVFGKAIKDVCEGKATGMSGNAVLAGTDATDVLGLISAKSVIYDKARKMPISGNLSVIYTKGASGDPTVLPVIGVVAEGTGAGTTLPLGQYDAIPGKWFATVAITSEMLEDVPSLEAAVIAELQGETGIAIDNSIMNGAFGSSIGFKGVVDDTNAVQADFAAFATPTQTELSNMVAKVNPQLHSTCEWYISPAQWKYITTVMLTAANLDGQLIKTGKNKELLGFPVNITFVLGATTPIVFGDMSKYVIGVRKELEIIRDDSVLFDTDEIMIKIRGRLCGGLAAGVRTYEDVDYAAIAYGQLTGS